MVEVLSRVIVAGWEPQTARLFCYDNARRSIDQVRAAYSTFTIKIPVAQTLCEEEWARDYPSLVPGPIAGRKGLEITLG